MGPITQLKKKKERHYKRRDVEDKVSLALHEWHLVS